MALTKKQIREILSKAGVDAESMDEACEAILTGHLASVDALREERDQYKTDAEKLPSVQKELDELKANPEDSYQDKFTALQQEYNDFKAQVENDKVLLEKREAYRALLVDAGVPEKRIKSILKVSESAINEIELEDGQIKGSDDVSKAIKEEWADLIPVTKTKGATVDNPPGSDAGGSFEQMSLSEKMAYANDNPDNEEVRAWLAN